MQPATDIFQRGAVAGERRRLEIDVAALDPAWIDRLDQTPFLPGNAGIADRQRVLYQTVASSRGRAGDAVRDSVGCLWRIGACCAECECGSFTGPS